MPATPPNPFADVDLDPAVKTIATIIHQRLTQWIDDSLDHVAEQLHNHAQALRTQITTQMQEKFDSMSQDMSRSLQDTLTNIAAINANLSDPTKLKAAVDQLQNAVVAQQTQVANRKQEFRQFGTQVGQAALNILLAAIKL